ncbi:MAG: hypothetical protein ACOY0T_14695 [Myxococcota bacterium]
MSHFRSVRRAFVTAGLALFIGCSSAPSGGNRNNESQGGSTNSSNGGSTSSGGNGSAQGGSGVNLGMGGSNNSSGNSGVAGDTCAATSVSAKLVPLDLYVMMDSSKSMNEPTSSGTTKWKATTDALKGFFADANSDGIGVALKFFPEEKPGAPASCSNNSDCTGFGNCEQRTACVAKGTFTKVVTSSSLCDANKPCANANEECAPVQRCMDGPNCAKVYCVAAAGAACPTDCVPFTGYCSGRDVCSAADYANPVVPFATLPQAASTLNGALDARMPDGYTPTGPALTGALQQAQERAKANPGRKVAVILVTDGLPGGFIPNAPPMECTPSKIPEIADVLKGATGTSGMPPIQTFVVGVFGPCDLKDQNVMPEANLNQLAEAGGTKKAVVISTDSNVQQQLQDALKQARTSAIACQYELPKPDSGSIDTGKVNVKFSSGSTGTKTILYVTEKAKCDPSNGGWYYDQDPLQGGKPTRIIVCDQSCSQFQSIQDGRVDIALRCKTEVPL